MSKTYSRNNERAQWERAKNRRKRRALKNKDRFKEQDKNKERKDDQQQVSSYPTE